MIHVYVEEGSLPKEVLTELGGSSNYATWCQGNQWLGLHSGQEGIWFQIDDSNPVIPEIARDFRVRGVSVWMTLWSVHRECGVYRVGETTAQLKLDPIAPSEYEDIPHGVEPDHFRYSLKTCGIVPLDDFLQLLAGIRDGSPPPETSWDKPSETAKPTITINRPDGSRIVANIAGTSFEESGVDLFPVLGQLLLHCSDELGIAIDNQLAKA